MGMMMGRGRLTMSDVVRFKDTRLGRPGPGMSSWSLAGKAVAWWLSASKIVMKKEIKKVMMSIW